MCKMRLRFSNFSKVANLGSCTFFYRQSTFLVASTNIEHALFKSKFLHVFSGIHLPLCVTQLNFSYFVYPNVVKKIGCCDTWRGYSKKKKRSIHADKLEELSEDDSDSDVEELDDTELDDIDEFYQGFKLITKSAATLRLDSVLKFGLRISKKTVEKKFYDFKIRLNGEKVMKKSISVKEGDEIDDIIGYSAENMNNIVVNRVVVKSIGKVTVSATYPIKLHVYNSLIIENYEDKWHSLNVETSND